MRAASTTETAATPSRRRAKRRRRARRRLGLGVALIATTAVLGGTALVLTNGDGTSSPGPTTQARAIPPLTGSPAPESASAAPAVTPSPAAADPATTPPPSPAVDRTKGKGTFTTAPADSPAFGHGTIRRFKVEVEDGIGVDPATAATQIRTILADKRSWTTDGKDGFQLVSDGSYDFTVRIASPTTVDRICATAGLNTGGEVNCDVGRQVMVNVKRWTSGSPQFTGTIDDYRALIVNHEVGHRIGHGHEGCPGPGKLAPAMMQQIYGLNGCLPNAWPYTADGTYISGPSVP